MLAIRNAFISIVFGHDRAANRINQAIHSS